jgi:hypothetical protein
MREICERCNEPMAVQPALYVPREIQGVPQPSVLFCDEWFLCPNGHAKGYPAGHSFIPGAALSVPDRVATPYEPARRFILHPKRHKTLISTQSSKIGSLKHDTYSVSEELSMPERRLIPDKGLGGYMCNACGWAWPTLSSVPARSSPEQALQDDFNAHDCSTHPLSLLKN